MTPDEWEEALASDPNFTVTPISEEEKQAIQQRLDEREAQLQTASTNYLLIIAILVVVTIICMGLILTHAH